MTNSDKVLWTLQLCLPACLFSRFPRIRMHQLSSPDSPAIFSSFFIRGLVLAEYLVKPIKFYPEYSSKPSVEPKENIKYAASPFCLGGEPNEGIT